MRSSIRLKRPTGYDNEDGFQRLLRYVHDFSRDAGRDLIKRGYARNYDAFAHPAKLDTGPPRSILFACADGGYYVKRLRWRSWRTWRAVGRGAFHFNDCDLTCVDGTFHKRKGRLILRRRLWCPSISKYVFKRAEIRYRRPWQGDRRYSWRLSCPF
jgi:hypothetical protein